jgi:uncharacterized protein (TIGR04222 family)
MNPTDAAQWTDEQRALWQRLRDYRFGGEHPQAYVDRIAHAIQSSREAAEAALEEYRRFCFLAVVATHTVTPSETIDKVWHAHMTDTRDYWLRFCPQVLKRDLHHTPSLGGQVEDSRHQQQYRDTLDSYRSYFDEPPAALWPPARVEPPPRKPMARDEARLRLLTPWASAPRGVGVGVWLASAALITLWVLLAPAQGSFNVLNWRGGAFLAFYLFALVWGFLAGSAVKRLMRGPNTRDGKSYDDFVELGFLAGGAERAADVAIVELMERGVLSLDYQGTAYTAAQQRDEVWLRIDAAQAALLTPPLRTAADVAAREQTMSATLKALERAYTPIAAQLRRKGWWLPKAREWQIRLIGSAPLLALAVLGVMKLMIGLARDKPVGFLFILLILTVFMYLGRLLRAQPRTRAGEWVLYDASEELSGAEPMHRAALMGTIGLVGTDYSEYHTLRTPVSSSSSSDSNSSGGSGCSSSGDGGGGGGGCGGCGGGGD